MDTKTSSSDAQSSSWGGWLSSMASSAYDSMLGDVDAQQAPEMFEALQPNGVISRDGQETNEFSGIDSASRQALWKQLLSVIGMDVMNMRLSLPIWLFEPSTALTRMCETFEYFEVLDRAAKEKDPVMRDALVAAFVISAFAHTERVRKPFNPVLGETFAYEDREKGMRFLAEQVSHHPPISVSRCSGKGWTGGESVDVQATYMGNSIHISNSGPMASRYVDLHSSDDQYTWTLPKAVVSNLFIGGTFIDHFGEIELFNHTTKTCSVLKLTKCGWFSSGRYRVTGELLDSEGNVTATYDGYWNKYLDCEKVEKAHGQGVMRVWAAGKHLLSDEEGGGPSGSLPKFTKFGAKILALDDDIRQSLPPTDSRLRPDRLALQNLDSVGASSEKLRIEQAQRDRAKNVDSSSDVHVAKWFTCTGEGEDAKWDVKDDYWAYASSIGKTDNVEEEALW